MMRLLAPLSPKRSGISAGLLAALHNVGKDRQQPVLASPLITP
jgi:hypothetical protein